MSEARGRGRPKTEERIAVEARIRELTDEHGRLTPQIVVDDAKDPKSPLHGEFEWDNVAAGDAHRLQQARALIQSVKVVITTTTSKMRVPVYTRDPEAEPREQGYRSVLSVNPQSEEDIARDMIIREIEHTRDRLNRAVGYAEHFGMVERVEGIKGDVEELLK